MKTTMHCGYCLPCTIRRASIQKGGLHDTSTYFDSSIRNFLSQDKHIELINVHLVILMRIMHFLRIQESGPIIENIEQFADLYVRGMKEMREYLEKIHV